MFSIRTLKTILMAASLAVFSNGAAAATALVMGSLNADLTPGEYALSNVQIPGAFTDSWQFTLAQDSAVSFELAQAVVPGFWEISDFAGNLAIGGGITVSGLDFMISGLDAVSVYDFQVTGLVSGSFAGSYVGQLTVIEEIAPIPVPAAAWLFGSALMGLIGIRRRKLA